MSTWLKQQSERGLIPSNVALQLTVTLGNTHEGALKNFRASQLYKQLESLKNLP